ncbi:exosome component 5 [Planoprotostelium fungivorum]|uniref:Exosome component 5 n=1 Tax=Planoprotostelium fungivorum TaxID=1890364 RepID=A0A2P6N083_9EUKA|nr:exosome component 5 [Planoprotostelium fungivorum]
MRGSVFFFIVSLLALGQCEQLFRNSVSSISVSVDLSVVCGQRSGYNTIVYFSSIYQHYIPTYPDIAFTSVTSISGDSKHIIAVKDGRFTSFPRVEDEWRESNITFSPDNNGTSVQTIVMDLTGTRFVALSADGQQSFYEMDATGNFTLVLKTSLPDPMFSTDLMVALVYQNDAYVVCSIDWTHWRVTKEVIPVDYTAPITAVNSDGTAFVAFDTLFRKSGGFWIPSSLDKRFTFADFSGDNRYLLASSTQGQLVRYLVNDVTRSHLPLMSMFGPNSLNGRPIIYSNQRGDQMFVLGLDGQVNSFSTPSPPYNVRGVCTEDSQCLRGLTCGPAHYCYTPRTSSLPDNYDISSIDPFGRVVFTFNCSAKLDCIDAGSSPVGVTDFSDSGDLRYVYNNTRLQMVYYDEWDNVKRSIERNETLSPSRSNVVILVPRGDEKRVEFRLSSVCRDSYADSAPRIVSSDDDDYGEFGNCVGVTLQPNDCVSVHTINPNAEAEFLVIMGGSDQMHVTSSNHTTHSISLIPCDPYGQYHNLNRESTRRMIGILGKSQTKTDPEHRTDRRKPAQFREMSAEQGILNRADGSARFVQGHTSVVASVYGPMEVRQKKKEIMDRAYLEITLLPINGVAGGRERDMEVMLKDAFDGVILAALHPRTCISVVVQVVQDAGSLLSVALNAITLALLDAGISMNSLLASSTCAVRAGVLLMDPTEEEEKSSEVLFDFGISNTSENIVLSKTSGHQVFSQDQYFHALNACRDGTKKIFSFFRECMETKHENS